ncbi:hypothetical protein NDU88_007261 [Pleurodeles waltl]|uniref:Uncharacterized protein n=1 Tax=Pleurodeles waltl TaxID=8319 RepID=A0AAV7PNU0_PLEWA|nr:hypothetical protein NDU88_007261 [Pleurodeles waltl]
MQSSEVRQGLTSTKLGLKGHWTVGATWTELLDSRDLARRAERRPKGPVMQLFGACGCRGKIPWQKVKREMQRNSDELLHSLSKESQETETLNSQKRGFGYLGERIG